MANTIKLKRGTGSDPSASDLVLGEIAIRTDTGKLFTKKDNGTVAEISGSGGGGSDIFINTLSSSSGSGGGSASFNGSATRFTLSNPPDVSAQQLLVSINGVIQKPNSGTSPSEGFALDGTDIIFAAAPATGADFFIITYGSIGVSVPADNSVTSAKIVDGAIVNADINASAAIARTKLANVDLVDDTSPQLGGALDTNNQNIEFGDVGNASQNRLTFGASGDMKIFHDASSSKNFISTIGNNDCSITSRRVDIKIDDNSETMASFIKNGAVELYYDNSKKFLTSATGITVNGGAVVGGNIEINQDAYLKIGANNDLNLTHTGTDSYIQNVTGDLYIQTTGSGDDILIESLDDVYIRTQGSEPSASFIGNGQVELYYDGSKKFETTSSGVKFTGVLEAVDNQSILLGNSDDFRIRHTGSHSEITDEGTGDLRLGATRTVIGNTAFNETQAMFIQNGAVELYHDGSKRFETTSIGVDITGEINVGGNNSRFAENNLRFFSAGNAFIDHGTVGQDIVFRTSQNSPVDTTALTIDASDAGTAIFNHDVKIPDNGKLLLGNSGDIDIFHDGTNGIIANNTGVFYLKTINGEFTLVGRPNAQTELYYDHSKKFETISSGIKILGDASTGSIIQGDLRLKAADSGTTLVHWNPENSEIRWDDDYKASFGDGGDLQISHSSTYNNSLIYNGTNDLYFRSGTAFYFQNKAGSENQATFVENGRVDLYFDNSKKFETTSSGATLTGNLTTTGEIISGDDINLVDNKKIVLGTGADLQIVHNGTSSFIDNHNSGHIYIRNNDGSDFGGNIYIQAKSGESSIDIIHDGSVQLFYNNDRVFYTETRGVRLADNTKIYENSSHNTAVIQHADIHHAIILRGATNNNGSTITNENTTTFREYGQMQFRTGGNGNMPVRLTIASNGVVSGNLNDTSDEKFKENIVSIADGAISKIKQLRPVNFDWKKEMQVEDAKGESGFIAQEVLTVIPDLVKGIEYKEDEKSSGYSVNTTGLVAYLTKALQEVIARLETLEGG